MSVISSADSFSSPATLESLYVFNTRLGQKEGTEHEKILFYHCAGRQIDVGEQTKNVGLCEALINFTKSFSPSKPAESLHTQKRRIALLTPEPDHWFALSLNNPSIITSSAKGVTTEWHEEELDDLMLQRVLGNIYSIYRLFNGPFSRTSVADAKKKLAAFLPLIIATINFEQMNILTTLDGISYLPLDKNVYLRIQCMINLVENSFPQILSSSFIFRDNLVWSGLEQDNMRILYGFLHPILSGSRVDKWASHFPFVNHAKAEFLIGPEDLNDSKVPIKTPQVYIDAENPECYLIMYQHITMIHVVEASVAQDLAFHKNLLALVLPQLDFLAPVIGEHYLRKMGTVEEGHRYIYFNHMNLAIKTSLKQKQPFAQAELMKVVNDIHADFERSPEAINEIMIRMNNDAWIVGRKSEQREFYVVVDNTHANLSEVNEEVRKLSQTYFGNIFIDWS